MIQPRYLHLCPNCGGPITAQRLSQGLPCTSCLPEPPEPLTRETLCRALAQHKTLRHLEPLCTLHQQLEAFRTFFEKRVGAPPWSLQETWAIRTLLGESFTLTAPTGVGKTTFGLAMAAFLPGKSYLLVPTRLLVQQTADRLKTFTHRPLVAFTGRERKHDRETLLQRVREGRFDLLVTTTMFLHRHFADLLHPFRFDFIFVDDVDALLKTSRNIEYLLLLLGFSAEDIALASKRQVSPEEQDRLEQVRQKRHGVLAVASATAQPRTQRVRLLRNLLGFEVQRSRSFLRNIVDVQENTLGIPAEELRRRAVERARQLGPGGFLYLPLGTGREGVEALVQDLEAAGIPALSYEKFDPDAQEAFRRGEIQAVVGISHQANPLVRGIDLPDAVRYALFVGVPRRRFQVEATDRIPQILNLLSILRPLARDPEALDRLIRQLRRFSWVPPERLPQFPRVRQLVEEARKHLESLIQAPDFRERIQASDDIALETEKDTWYLVIGDAVGYLQASGRTSRLYAGGLTRGLSWLLADHAKALRSLERRLQWFDPDLEFRSPEEIDLPALLQEIDHDRQRYREFQQGKGLEEARRLLKTTLVIVESPTKARTLASFYGTPGRKWIQGVPIHEIVAAHRLFLFTASLGHVTDLVTRQGVYGVEVQDSHLIPLYDTIKRCPDGTAVVDQPCPKNQDPERDKGTLLKALGRTGLEVGEVLVATDPDTEGEKIAHDLLLALKPYNTRIQRIEFHEITRRAFEEALANPRDLLAPRVQAQMVRRIADRWVGFALSHALQRAFGNAKLSAGRVQTPVLGWVIEREQERRKRRWIVELEAAGVRLTLRASNHRQAEAWLQALPRAALQVERNLEKTLNPPPPFTTDTLLGEASRRLRFSAQYTMQLAQELFEHGLITYHRTDSTHVSEAGRRVAREYLREQGLLALFRPRAWSAEGAHECIRPARPLDAEAVAAMLNEGVLNLEHPRDALRLYRLIFQRFLASQSLEARVAYARVRVILPEAQAEEEVPEHILQEGFLRFWPLKTTEVHPEAGLRPLGLRSVPGAVPFTQGTLIAEMKQRGIGRPSTYAKIVQTLLERRYVVERRGFLYPTRLGFRVYSYLRRRFPLYTSEEFTRVLEERMDQVEAGTQDPVAVLWDLVRAGRLRLPGIH